MNKKLLFSIVLVSILFGCKQKDVTPSWLMIDSFELSTTESTQGSNTTNISDAWVYMDGQPLGVFEVPCKIPILDEGEHAFIIFASIIEFDGYKATRKKYPFYTSFETTATLIKGDSILLSPKITYKNQAKFSYLEDFEDAGIALIDKPEDTTDAKIVFINKSDNPEIVKYGEKCGGVFLTSDLDFYIEYSEEKMDLLKSNQTYLEMDYRNDNSIGIGVIATSISSFVSKHPPVAVINGQESGKEVWKKIYIDLTIDIRSATSASSFDFFLISTLDSTNTTANIYVDNIKVVHF